MGHAETSSRVKSEIADGALAGAMTLHSLYTIVASSAVSYVGVHIKVHVSVRKFCNFLRVKQSVCSCDVTLQTQQQKSQARQ